MSSATSIIEWLKVLGSPLVAVAVFFLTWFYNRWQVRLAKQKLRSDLFDRRLAIYTSFQDLLLALPEKNDLEIESAFRKASVARHQAAFLLGDDAEIENYLDRLCAEIDRDVIANIRFCEAFRRNAELSNDPQAVAEFMSRASRLGVAKLQLTDSYLTDLPKRFTHFLKLTDFS